MPVLQFKGKSVVESYHHTVPHCRLEFDAKLSCLAKGQKPTLDDNLIVEGDNLLALKALLPTHAGRIKCVYIDPPYNTGNEGWIYNDNLTQPQFKEWIGREVGKEGEDACRHDKWCCMMYPRLMLLRELLREDGAIWVSIDDNEAPRLRILMDEVFGDDCFAAQIAVLSNRKGRGLRGGFARSHDYIVVYTKRAEGHVFETTKSPEQIQREYPEKDENGTYRFLELRNTHKEFGRHNRKNLFFPLYVAKASGTVHLEAKPGHAEVWPIWDDGFEGCWSWSRKKVTKEASELMGREVKGRWKVFRRSRPTARKPKTLWHRKGFLTEKGQKLLTSLFGDRVFHAPKPLELIKEIIRFSTTSNDVVLDACAGSGTTGHAVLELNEELSRGLHFVLVQQPHDSKKEADDGINICRRVTQERVRKVITQKKTLGASFSYIHVGEPLFGEYKEWGKKPPPFADLARYVFYTETSRQSDPAAFDEASGFIGSTEVGGGTSYYLMYTPNEKASREFSLATLDDLAKRDDRRRWVVYSEKFWMHPDEMHAFEAEHGKQIRHMLLPFQLK